MIFVPRGWWHCVLNVDDTVAVTQNYVSDCNLTQVLHFLQTKGEQVASAILGAKPPALIPPFRFPVAATARACTTCLWRR
jgi:hypothetical protein